MKRFNQEMDKMPFQFFKLTENRGTILIVLAIVWPFIVVLPPIMDIHITLHKYIPWLDVNDIGRFFITFALWGGVLGSILIATYCTLARSPSILVKRLCFSSVIIAIIALAIFGSLIALNQWFPIVFYTSVVLGYIAVFLNIYVTSTELGKRYWTRRNQMDRNDTVHAWAAFLFSVDLLLIVGFLTLGIYAMMKA